MRRGLGFLFALHVALTTAASAPSSHQAACGLVRTDCTRIPFTLALERAANGSAAANSSACNRSPRSIVEGFCLGGWDGSAGVCTPPQHANLRRSCASHAVHTFQSTFDDKLLKRTLLWPIFFVIASLLIGALFKACLPRWLPYTVALLLFAICAGALSELLSEGVDCPMYALLHDADGDGQVSEAEWDEFICVGCHADSICLDTSTARTDYKRTCGDGSAAPDECGWTFRSLDRPWKKSAMLPESISPSAAISHRRLASSGASGSSSGSGSGSGLAPDGHSNPDVSNGLLSADELWTVRCNLLHDVISLQEIDPHIMLVVFLPALLFESACFGIDVSAASAPERPTRRHARPLRLYPPLGRLTRSLVRASACADGHLPPPAAADPHPRLPRDGDGERHHSCLPLRAGTVIASRPRTAPLGQFVPTAA